MQHLGVLTDAKLVVIRRQGKYRFNYLNPVPLQKIYDRWVSRFARPHAANVLALKAFVESQPASQNKVELEDRMSSEHASTIASASMIQVEIEIIINAKRERVWQALLHETPKWWRQDFFTSPRTKAFVIEPRVGGRAYEDYGDGNGAMWFTVNLLDAPSRLQWVGHMGGSFPGPAISIVEINLEESGPRTVLKLRDQLVGKVNEKSVTQMREGWKLLMDDSLKFFVEANASG